MTASSTTSAPISSEPNATAGSGWWPSWPPRSSSGCSRATKRTGVDGGGDLLRVRQGPSAGSASTTSTCSIPSSGPGSSRSAPTSPTRPRCGSTATSGPNAKPTGPVLDVRRRWPTGSPPARSPTALQAICDRFGPGDVQAFFDRWITTIPTPLHRRRPGRGLLVGAVDAPSRGVPHPGVRRPSPGPWVLRSPGRRQHRHRPTRTRWPSCSPARSARPPKRPYRTRVFRPGTEVKIDFSLQALPGQAIPERRESPAHRDRHQQARPTSAILARLEHLPELIAKARAVNGRLLMIERAGQGCAIGSALFERIHQPYIREGQRTGALRFGDPRAMALTGALCRVRPRRRRLHQQEPSRAGRRTARTRTTPDRR